MTVTQLLAVDLVVAILTMAVWLGAGVLAAEHVGTTRRAKEHWILIAMGCGFVGVAMMWWIAGLLTVHGWWFVQEKITFALPILTVSAIVATVFSLRPLALGATGCSPSGLPPLVPTLLIGAGSSAIAGIAARMVVGYPLDVAPALMLAVLVLLSMALSYAILARSGRRAVGSIAGFTAFVLVGGLGFVWLGPAVSLGVVTNEHGHGTVIAASHNSTAAQIPLTELPVEGLGQTGQRRTFVLTAAQQQLTLSSGATKDVWGYGAVPGPELRVQQGDRIVLTLRNSDIAEGVTIHWHGYDVPNKMDGVAGVTQNAVLPGQTFTYDFIAKDTGTYWYHTHQLSADGVRKGLYGVFVVLPREGIPESLDVSVPVHTFAGAVFFGSSDTAVSRPVPLGTSVRLRLINTDQQPHRLRIAGTAFRVVAVDGRNVNEPTDINNQPLRVPAGGRVDVALAMPAGHVTLRTASSVAVSLTLEAVGGPATEPSESTWGVPRPGPDTAARADVDLLSYGRPASAALPSGADTVEETMVLDRLPRLLDGLPAYGYTVNGAVYPHIPSIEVHKGDVVRLTVANRSWVTHPMHVHGHHVLVLSRDGVTATGSPLWLDTFDVQPGEVWVVALVADNPGIWMDHCHNLEHAAQGMMMQLNYSGVMSPFDHGGAHGNRPE